jgi:hypothetical protein
MKEYKDLTPVGCSLEACRNVKQAGSFAKKEFGQIELTGIKLT